MVYHFIYFITNNFYKKDTIDNMIELDNIKLAFDGKEVLNIQNLSFEDNRSYFIKGESGTGKTTLFNVISGLCLPDEGSVMVGDTFVHLLSEKDRDCFRAQNIGFIFQDFNLLDGFTVLENVMLPMTFIGKHTRLKNSKPKALDALQKVGLEDKSNIKVNKLSGGEKQRTAIARAVVNIPKVMLADEPTGNLDKANSLKITTLLLNMAKEYNATLIMISHDLSLMNLFDEVIDINDFNSPKEVEE